MTETFGLGPVSSDGTPQGNAYVPGTANSDLTMLEGMSRNGPDGNGHYSTGLRLGMKDGDNVTQGMVADAAVTGDTAGTVSAKLRGLSKLWADMWDSVNHRLHVAVDNVNANGQATMANSAPVVLASDEIVPAKSSFLEVIGQGPGVVNAINTDLIPSTDVSGYKWMSLQIEGTFVATLTFQKSNDGANWRPLLLQKTSGDYTLSSQSGTTASTSVVFEGPISTHFIRVRATSFTSNASLAGTLDLFGLAPSWLINAQTLTPVTYGGTTDYHLISAASTNGNNVKATGGQVYGYDIGNNGASDVWVKIYNKATTPTVGTDVVFRTIYVPKGQARSYHNTVGIPFTLGIGIGITGGAADADTTAVAAGQVTVELDIK